MSEEITTVESPSTKSKRLVQKKKTENTPKKLSRKVKKEAEISLKKIKLIVSHIRNVQDNAITLGEKLIELGEINLGRELIARAFIHDNSKFYGMEWDNMAPGTEINDGGAKLKLKLAISHHQKTNPHHVEYWNGDITQMPRFALAEFVCDIKARSEEFGTDLRQWIDTSATKRWGFTKDDPVYKVIMGFVNLLCEKPFIAL